MSQSNQAVERWSMLAAIAARQHGAFNLKQARPYFDARQLRAAADKGLLVRPLSDVFAFASHLPSMRQKCAIAALAGGVISHESAAALHQLDGFVHRSDPEIHVTYPRNHKRRLPGYRVHTWRHTNPSDITSVDGIACTSIARTISQLGLRQPRSVVESALDSALRAGASLAWIEQTHQRLVRPGPTGLEVFAEISADPARNGGLSESVLERLVERMLVEQGLPQPQRQLEVQVESGVRRLDLAFPDAQLGIEAHSRMIHFGAIRSEDDNTRDIELAAVGWEVVYITSAMAQNPELFIRHLLATYRKRRDLLHRAAGVA